MSLRTRLTCYYTGFFTFAMLLLGLGIYISVRHNLDQVVDTDLRAGKRQVLAIYERSPANGLDFVLRNGVLTPQQLRGQPAEIFVIPNLFVQVFSPSGAFLGSSMNVQTQPLPLPPAALMLQSGEELQITEQVGNTRMRSLIVPVELLRTRQIVGILQISRSMKDVDATLHLLLTILLGGGTIAVIITALGVAALSRTTLSPIDQVVRTAQSIVRAEDLGRRVPVPATNDELHRLSVTINDLLSRLEALFTAQRRLVADVSHELRTPLAAMQGNLEILERGAYRDPELFAESLTDMRQETRRLIRMVNDLLLLAQSEAGVQMRVASVELDTLLLEVHRELRALNNGVTLTIGAEDQVVVMGDRDRLKQALLNLGVNALQHTPTGGRVTLSLARGDKYACITVNDTGNGIASEDLPHIFERFYRADRSRSRHGGGSGLGLAIVKRVAEAHNGRVTVMSMVGSGSSFTLWLPILTEAPPVPTLTDNGRPGETTQTNGIRNKGDTWPTALHKEKEL